MLTQSVLSLEYVRVAVAATIGCVSYNPTADPVSMAFMAPGVSPGVLDWVTASWETCSSTYYARVLVGPGGVVTLPVDTYIIWIRVTDSPEVPIKPAGPFRIY